MKKTILYICLSRSSGGEEQRAVTDCDFFRRIAGKIYFYCLSDSWIDDELDAFVQQNDSSESNEGDSCEVEKVYHNLKNVNKFIDFHFYYYLRDLVRNKSIDLVHCYGLEGLGTISLCLRRMIHIPLFLTYNGESVNEYNSIYYRFIFSRVDRLFTLSSFSRDQVVQNFPIQRRKIEIAGAGIIFPPSQNVRKEKRESPGEKRLLASRIPNDIVDLSSIRPLLIALQRFKIEFNTTLFNLVFVARKEWISSELYESLVREIKNFDLDDSIDFITYESFYLEAENFDLWVEIDDSEMLTPEEILVGGVGIPLILPRTGIRRDFLNRNGRIIGETYKRRDARELKDQLVHLFENYVRYVKSARFSADKIRSGHDVNLYFQVLNGWYATILKRRSRLQRRGFYLRIKRMKLYKFFKRKDRK